MRNDLVISNFTGNVFRRAVLPERRVAKSASPDVAAFLNATDLDSNGNNGARIVTPYAQSSWVYIAITRLAEKVSSIPFRISRVGGGKAKRVRLLRNSSDPRHRAAICRALGETIIESGDVVDLFESPHPTMNRQLFWEMVVTWNCLRGEFFVLPLDAADCPVDLSDRAPRVQRLVTVPTELFWHVVTGYDLRGWRYTGSPLVTPIPSQFLLPTEVIHSRSPNPYLYWRGMSPLFLGMGPAGADYAAAQYAKGYWMNNADTGVIVTTEQQCDETQQKQILAALNERKRKAGTPDRPLFLWGGAKVEKPQLSGMEQQFIENRNMNRREIGAIYKVSDAIMGFSESTALSGGDAKKSEEQSFIENTIQPLCHHLEAAVAKVITTFGDDLIGWFDVDSLPVMQDARRSRVDTAVKAFGIGASFNDVNTVYDLGFQKKPWGDKSFLPFSLQEITAAGLGSAADLPSEDDPAEPAPNDNEDEVDPDDAADEAKANPFARMGKLLSQIGNRKSEIGNQKAPNAAALWRKRMNFRKQHVALFNGKVGKVLMQFRKKTLAKLDEVHLQKSAGQIQWQSKGLVDIIFDPHAFGASLYDELDAPIRGVLQAGGEMMRSEMGLDDPWKYPSKAMVEYLAGRTQPIKGAGQTVRARLNTTLVEGVENGEMHDELAARVKAVFTSLADDEARRIARTEVNSAATSGGFEAMTDAGIEYKSWLGSHGPRARQNHQDVEDATISDPIPVTEPFEVANADGDVEQMMFPLDGSLGASAGNIINCQCDVLAAQKISEDEKTATFKIFGVGEMKFLKR